jgi:hypothetical protein
LNNEHTRNRELYGKSVGKAAFGWGSFGNPLSIFSLFSFHLFPRIPKQFLEIASPTQSRNTPTHPLDKTEGSLTHNNDNKKNQRKNKIINRDVRNVSNFTILFTGRFVNLHSILDQANFEGHPCICSIFYKITKKLCSRFLN